MYIYSGGTEPVMIWHAFSSEFVFHDFRFVVCGFDMLVCSCLICKHRLAFDIPRFKNVLRVLHCRGIIVPFVMFEIMWCSNCCSRCTQDWQ